MFHLWFGSMMNRLLGQLKQRRLALGLKQKDMMMRVGVSRQQYQQIESKGNPRLSTLELIAQGLNCELMLIPKEKVKLINDVLQDNVASSSASTYVVEEDNPWKGLLEGFE